MLLCPLCARPLRAVERQGVEIDHCADCGGFWLDQGELDSLVRQEAVVALMRGQQAMRESRREREYDRPAAEDADFVGEYHAPAAAEPGSPRFGMARNAPFPAAKDGAVGAPF
jgi:Zn-finger nucleic acid-binding protein